MRKVLGLLILGLIGFIGYSYDDLNQIYSNITKQDQVIKDRVINLPYDQHKYHLTLALNPNHSEANNLDYRIKSWFYYDPRLVRLRDQTHFHIYTPEDNWFKRNSHIAVNLPVIIIQRNDGYVFFKLSKENLPNSASELANLIADCCPRPTPQPEPEPTPEPFPDIIPDEIPDDIPDEAPVQDDFGVLVYILAALLGGGASYAFNVKKERLI